MGKGSNSISILELTKTVLADSSDPCYDFFFRLEFGYPFPDLIFPPTIDSFHDRFRVVAMLFDVLWRVSSCMLPSL